MAEGCWYFEIMFVNIVNLKSKKLSEFGGFMFYEITQGEAFNLDNLFKIEIHGLIIKGIFMNGAVENLYIANDDVDLEIAFLSLTDQLSGRDPGNLDRIKEQDRKRKEFSIAESDRIKKAAEVMRDAVDVYHPLHNVIWKILCDLDCRIYGFDVVAGVIVGALIDEGCLQDDPISD